MYALKITSIPNIFMIILTSTFSRKKKKKNGSLLPKITHICGKETKFQSRIDTPALQQMMTHGVRNTEKAGIYIFYYDNTCKIIKDYN